jgi:hypothetical protein
LGIGTTSPDYALDVSGKIALDGTVIAYRPTAFTGTLILGNGGGNLSHASGLDGYYNTFVGLGVGNANTTGNKNTANGVYSLYNNTEGINNTANGEVSLFSNIIGDSNTANGAGSLYYTIGDNNTADGFNSLYYNTGNYNTALGANSGKYIADGSNKTTGDYGLYLGYNSKASAIGTSNEIVIGYDAIGNGSNTVTIGSSSIATTILRGNIGVGTTTTDYQLTVDGTSYFSQPVIVGTPTADNHAATKSYVDDVVGSTSSSSTSTFVLKTGDVMSGDLNMGTHNITNINKLTITTIDPLYDIRGTKYSTYVPSLVGGVKEEYIGKGNITNCNSQNCSWRLDFQETIEGSDLWVWRQIVDFQPDNVDILMTAYGQPVPLSYEIEDNQIIFYASEPTKFSYRLIGARHDWRQWPTLAIDQSETASMIIK